MKCCLWLDNFVVWSVGTCVLSLLVFPFINKLKTHLIDLSLIIMLQEAWNKLSLNISDCKKRYPIRCLYWPSIIKLRNRKANFEDDLVKSSLTNTCVFSKWKWKKGKKKKFTKEKKKTKKGFFSVCLLFEYIQFLINWW